MQSESAAWLIIRTLGLILFGFSFFQIFEFIMNLIFIALCQPPVLVVATPQTIRLPNLRWDPVIYAIVFGALSIYFLKYGATVHKWLIKTGKASNKVNSEIKD